MIKKRIKACVSALLGLGVILVFFSRITEPKYTGNAREGNLIGEYYRAADNDEQHDIIFIGDCEAYCTFSPPILWKEENLTSHVRGSPAQTVLQSYHVLCETLEYEHPKVIVLSVYGMCREKGADEVYNRMTLDGMRISIPKVRAVWECIGKDESKLSYFLPILRFHSRWSDISRDDIIYLFSSPQVSHNGYFMRCETVAAEEREYTESDRAPYMIPTDNFTCLDRIRQLCAEKNIGLILVKSPTSSWRYPWYSEWSGEIERYCAMHSLEYYDLTARVDEIGIDMSTDSYDGGLHLNVYGAEKTTRFFGKILREHLRDTGHGEEVKSIWKEKLERYYNERNQND